jgi:hypothetical protein
VLRLSTVLPESAAKARYEQVKVGMTREQVEAIFGTRAAHGLGVQIVTTQIIIGS